MSMIRDIPFLAPIEIFRVILVNREINNDLVPLCNFMGKLTHKRDSLKFAQTPWN